MRDLFNRNFPPGLEKSIGEDEVCRYDSIPDEGLRDVILLLKSSLVDFIPPFPHRGHRAGVSFHPRVLTIGFARRFAACRRPNLLLEEQRLWSLLSDPVRPVQIVFSGKAHSRDDAGRDIVRRVHRFVSKPRAEGLAVFLEDYDMNVCRHPVQGAYLFGNSRRGPRFRLLPELQVYQDLLDDRLFLYEGYDLHFSLTFRAEQRVKGSAG